MPSGSLRGAEVVLSSVAGTWQTSRSLDRQTAAIRLMDLGVLDPSLSTVGILMINKEPVIHDSLPFRGALLESSLTSFINQAQPSLPPSHITRLKFTP